MEEGQFRIVQLSDLTRGLEEQCSQCVSPAGPASGSFPLSQLFPSGGQHNGASVSASVLPMNILD